MEIDKPIVLELVPDGDHVRPVLVTKCDPVEPTYKDSLNQRDCYMWPEITMWPKGLRYGLSTGQLIIVASDHDQWTIGMHLWNQEAYVYKREVLETLSGMLRDLPIMRALSRRGKRDSIIEPLPEDFGDLWYEELQEIRRNRRQKVK